MKKVFAILFILIVLSVVFYNNKSFKAFLIQKELKQINSDSLGKYYQIFRVKFPESYKKDQFLNFLGENNSLFKKISNPNIYLNAEFVKTNEVIFSSIRYIGPDPIHNEAGPLPMYFYFKNSNFDTIELGMKNYFDLKINRVYALENDSLLKLDYYNTSFILANSINCDKEKVKMKLDTAEYSLSAFKFVNQQLFVENDVDEQTLNVLLNDSTLKDIVVKYPHVYVPFSYKPLSYFYCDDE